MSIIPSPEFFPLKAQRPAADASPISPAPAKASPPGEPCTTPPPAPPQEWKNSATRWTRSSPSLFWERVGVRFGAPRHCSPNHLRAPSSTMDSLRLMAGISSRGGRGGRGDVLKSSICEHHQTDLRTQSFGENSARLHPPSSILHPSSSILHPSSFILHPSSIILHPSSFILHPSSFILYPSSFILHQSADGMIIIVMMNC